MLKVPAKVQKRIAAGLKRFQPILSGARARDVSEADTVKIVTDVLSEVFGYDKYEEVTAEHAIRGTYCDLAIHIAGSLELLIEVKSAGLDLKDGHTRQAIDYAAKQGTEWVVLTNGCVWQVYHVTFAQPIDFQLVATLDLLALNARSKSDVESLYVFVVKASRTFRLDFLVTLPAVMAAMPLVSDSLCAVLPASHA